MAPKVDYSVLEVGQRLQVESGGVYYAAEVVTVSTNKKRANAPVKVHFCGYTAADDEFVGASRMRCKALTATAATAAKGTKAAKGDSKPRAEPAFEVGYWGIRGLGSVIRMIFEYKEAKYTDVKYSGEGVDPPNGGKWFKDAKPKIQEMNPLANLPYIVDGDTCVCQTNAILTYLSKRFRLGNGAKARLMNEQLLCEVYDVRNGQIDLVYKFKNVTRTKDEFDASAAALCDKPPFDKFEAWFAKYETEYLTGKAPNTADFHLWEMLDQVKILAERIGKPSILDKFPKCQAFYNRFRGLPTLQKYFASEDYKLPINNALMTTAWFA